MTSVIEQSDWPEAPRPERDRFAAGLVVHLVAATTGVEPRAIVGEARVGAAAARARQIAMYLAHTGFRWTLARTGQAFSRHPTTVNHACRRVEDMREGRAFDARIAAMETCLQGLPLEGALL